jgi:type VI secretion system protein VasG
VRIPLGTLTADEGVRLMALEGDLGRRVKGQSEAISAVAEGVRLARAQLSSSTNVFSIHGPSYPCEHIATSRDLYFNPTVIV